MARDVESLEPDGKVKRQVGRALFTWLLLSLSLVVLLGWAYFGFYQVNPGQNAVILRLGSYLKTVETPGLKWHLPPPLETHDLVSVDAVDVETFGFRGQEPTDQDRLEGTVQTSDNNIVLIGFEVQYQIKDAFKSRYRVAHPRETLRDTSQAAIREVIGRTTIDGVLSDRRGAVETATRELLQELLDSYETGLLVKEVNLLDAQPPLEVRDAFDDVVAASQDKSRAINEAQGYANEVLPTARADAAKLREAAQGYRDARIAESTGEAARFTALLTEYRKAPEVTRRRLYLETMEAILPDVDKVVVEPGTATVLPYFPVGAAAPPAVRPAAEPSPRVEPPPAAAPAPSAPPAAEGGRR